MNKNITNHHDDSLYYECLARRILEDRYKSWKFEIIDKPDLQDSNNKIGIEVTQVFPKGYNQAVSLMNQGKKIEGKLQDEGYEQLMPGLLVHPGKTYMKGKPFPAFDYLIEGIEKKINKVKAYQKDFKELDLYVFTDTLDIDIDSLKSLFLKIIEINNGSFDNIFIDACYKIFHLKDEYAGVYNIDVDKYKKYQYEAIDIEEGIINE